jgi:hypothetical protein
MGAKREDWLSSFAEVEIFLHSVGDVYEVWSKK